MIKVLKLHEDAQLPKAAHPGTSQAWDIYSVEDALVKGGSITTIRTGIAVQFEAGINAGFILRERSSQAKAGIKLLGGVIDSDYQGEWLIMLTLLNNDLYPNLLEPNVYEIKKGDRIAQAICIPTLTGLPIDWTTEFKKKTERGEGKFGSTGK